MKPRVGAKITVIDKGSHGPSAYRWGTGDVLEAYVMKVGAHAFSWRATDTISGAAWHRDEDIEWTHGHGAEARGALLAARALRGMPGN